MRFLGAKVVLTPRAAKGMGMYKKAQELAEANGWFYARQFETAANANIHENTTAREMLADFKGERLDYWVTGYGTGGTVSGVGRVLRKERPETKIIVSEPSNAPLLGSGTPRSAAPTALPPAAIRVHAASDPGLDPDFIPYVLQEAVDKQLLRRDAADRRPRRDRLVAQARAEEGIFTGISGGASSPAAHAGRRDARRRARSAACCPTPASATCRRRCSRASPTDMTAEEEALSKSTPGFQMPAA